MAVVTLVLVGAAAAGFGSATARAGGSSAANTAYVNVTAVGGAVYQFDPTAIPYVATNSTIHVAFTDAGDLAHTFSILNWEGVVIPSSADVQALAQQHGLLIGLNASGSGTVDGTFTSPGTGWYEYVCLEAGHFAQGMYGFIAFGEALPANLSVSAPSTGPGLAVFIITGTIVALVVIALVLGFVIGQRRGSQHEMAPERLGYPEPPTSTGENVPPEPATETYPPKG